VDLEGRCSLTLVEEGQSERKFIYLQFGRKLLSILGLSLKDDVNRMFIPQPSGCKIVDLYDSRDGFDSLLISGWCMGVVVDVAATRSTVKGMLMLVMEADVCKGCRFANVDVGNFPQ
jgi:hypothetical protein